MAKNSWRQIVTDKKIPAAPAGGLWTIVHEIVSGPCQIKVEAAGKWQYADEPEAECGPDGQTGSYIASSRCVNDKAPVGALIGKVGGSTADKEGNQALVVGRFCVHKLKETSGALFLTINDIPTGYADNQGELTVNVYTKDVAADSAS